MTAEIPIYFAFPGQKVIPGQEPVTRLGIVRKRMFIPPSPQAFEASPAARCDSRNRPWQRWARHRRAQLSMLGQPSTTMSND